MKPALLIIDMQNDFFQTGPLAEQKEDLVANINELINEARQTDTPVIWIRQEYQEDLSDAPLHNRRNNKSVTITGTSGVEILSELDRQESDQVVIKKRFSAFYQTELQDLLQELNIDTLIVTGVNTMTCVRVTAIDAYQRDYQVILALDCVDAYDQEQHDNSIKYLQYSVSVGKTNTEIIEILRAL